MGSEIMIQTGIIGYGMAGRLFHGYLISQVEGLNLKAVATRDEGRRRMAMQERSVDTYKTLRDLLSDKELRLIIIATPHHTHASLAIEAMQAGRHVVVDKVMCMSGAEAEEMIRVSQEQGVMLSVFQNRRWDWGFLTIKKALGDGLLGSPFFIERAVHRFRQSVGWRASRIDSGGLLYDWGSHLVDQGLQLISANPLAVLCRSNQWSGDIEDHVSCSLFFKNKVEYRIEISNLSSISKPHWFILGTEGSLVKTGLDPQEEYIKNGQIEAAVERVEDHVRLVRAKDRKLNEIILEPVKGSWMDYYHNISSVLNFGSELKVKPQEMLNLMKVMDAASKSEKSGQIEPIY